MPVFFRDPVTRAPIRESDGQPKAISQELARIKPMACLFGDLGAVGLAVANIVHDLIESRSIPSIPRVYRDLRRLTRNYSRGYRSKALILQQSSVLTDKWEYYHAGTRRGQRHATLALAGTAAVADGQGRFRL
ncbi:hypothetical protein D9M68_429140 [compost metagenome]